MHRTHAVVSGVVVERCVCRVCLSSGQLLVLLMPLGLAWMLGKLGKRIRSEILNHKFIF